MKKQSSRTRNTKSTKKSRRTTKRITGRRTDHYSVLGIKADATEAAIKKAYRKIAFESHPDRNPGNKDAEQRFRAATEAYEVLGDRQRRAHYDAGGTHDNFTPEPALAYGMQDHGNGRRCIALFGDKIRRVRKWDKWLVWNDHIWSEEDDGALQQMATATAMSIHMEAETRPSQARDIHNFADRTLSVVGREMMLKSMAGEEDIQVKPLELNQQPLLLNVANGTVELETGTLREARQEDKLTRMSHVEYDPNATDEGWDKFLKRMFPDPDVRDYVQRAMGYAISGLTEEDVFFVFVGEGGSGKSTFLKAITNVLGKEYASTADINILLNKRENRFAFARHDMSRIVTAQESGKDTRFDAGLIKAITGSTDYQAERKGCDDYDFVPQWTWLLASNYRPVVEHDDTGVWRRLREIPINKPLPRAKQDPRIRKHLWERPEAQRAILAWLVKGFTMFRERRLGAPPAVALACDEYRYTGDSFGKFLRYRVEFDPRGAVNSEYTVVWADLMAAYVAWCEEESETLVDLGGLPRRVSDLGFASVQVGRKDKRAKGRQGIRLIELSLEDELDALHRESDEREQQEQAEAANEQAEMARYLDSLNDDGSLVAV